MVAERVCARRLLLDELHLRGAARFGIGPEVLVDLRRGEELVATERRDAVVVVVAERGARVVPEPAQLAEQQLEHPAPALP